MDTLIHITNCNSMTDFRQSSKEACYKVEWSVQTQPAPPSIITSRILAQSSAEKIHINNLCNLTTRASNGLMHERITPSMLRNRTVIPVRSKEKRESRNKKVKVKEDDDGDEERRNRKRWKERKKR